MEIMLKNDAFIAVAMSGGVDSSVAAALLKDAGYKVAGFYMKNWSDTCGLKESDCPWQRDREDACRAAAKLDIPFQTLDFEKEYRQEVLDYFFKEYEAGGTPNPDVLCNAHIKFGAFLEAVSKLGADYIATGHYARLKREIPSRHFERGVLTESRNLRDNPRDPSTARVRFGRDDAVFRLLKAKDQNKDQTYFLYRLNQNQLSKAMFPVGELTKPEVRQLAKKFGLPNHDKPDSQGVCFIGHIDLAVFLKQKIKEKPGDIVKLDGTKVGKHSGLFWYTIGQRKGIGVGGIGPFYVVRKDAERNELVVTDNPKDEALYSRELIINDVNWISGVVTGRDLSLQARIRYREPLSDCTVIPQSDGSTLIRFDDPQWAIAAGQSVVFYNGEVCLGGGVIEKASRDVKERNIRG